MVKFFPVRSNQQSVYSCFKERNTRAHEVFLETDFFCCESNCVVVVVLVLDFGECEISDVVHVVIVHHHAHEGGSDEEVTEDTSNFICNFRKSLADISLVVVEDVLWLVGIIPPHVDFPLVELGELEKENFLN
jgi:hypothetical protein